MKRVLHKILRYPINRRLRKRIKIQKNNPITIISSNCIGGVILHELGLPFETPTINLYFEPKFFLEFISDLKKYISLPISEKISEGVRYPIGTIGDKVEVHFLHYDSFEQAKSKWEDRKKRINYNNLFFILTDRNGLTFEDAKRFDDLPYENKILLTVKDYKNIECNLNFGGRFAENSTDGEQIIDLCAFENKFTRRRYLDNFDFVKFLNRNEEHFE